MVIIVNVSDITRVHMSGGVWEVTDCVSGCFGVKCSVAPTRRKKLEQVVSRLSGVCSDFPCLFPDCRVTQVLNSG